MTRPFSPLDSLRLRAQQTSGTALEIETDILVGHSPLRQALHGSWRLNSGRVKTLVLTPSAAGGTEGFVQCRVRDTFANEADLTFVSPALTAVEGASLAWQRLFVAACQHLGARGVERVFVAAAEDDRVALQVLRQLGFNVWTNDVVFVRNAGMDAPNESADLVLVEPTADIDYQVQVLVHRRLPDSVRSEIPDLGADWTAAPGGGFAPGPALYRAWLGDRHEVRGAYRFVCGRTGHWLRVVTDSGADAEVLLRSALRSVSRDGRVQALPVYASARGYEPELNLALREHGFEPSARRFHLVKHTTARVLAPAWRDKQLREAALRRAPTSSARSRMVGKPRVTEFIRSQVR